MGKFINWIMKKIRGFKNREVTPPAGSPAKNPISNEVVSDIETSIDRIIEINLPMMGHLLNFQQNTKYWQSVFKALAYAESSFKLNCRYVEPPSLGKDVVTGVQNTSEGLLQLSYQDSRYHACEFDWSEDRHKNSLDISKTIFDIRKNITCGLAIMNKLVGKNGHYIFNSGNYWAVLKPNNKRHKIFIEKFNQYQRGA